MQEVDDRPVKQKRIEYRFYFFYPTGNSGIMDSSETAESAIRRADPDEKAELAKWVANAKPGDWKRIQGGYGLVMCHRAEGEGTKTIRDVYPDEEGYDAIP